MREIRQYLQQMAKTDAINRRILQELSQDGRISNIELADRAGLSPSACLRRVQELERAGIITGYRAVIDHRKLGAALSPMSPLVCRATPRRPRWISNRPSPTPQKCANATT